MEQRESRASSWFPGHMKKAQRRLEEDVRLVDAVLIVLDARCPATTRNPHLERIFQKKNRRVILVLNKSDMASPAVTSRWVDHFRAHGLDAVAISTKTGKGLKALRSRLDAIAAESRVVRERKGLQDLTLRLMVAGVPNAGKSSLINALVRSGSVKTGKKPGLTRGKQWLGIGGYLEMMDTPGIMMPRIETQDALHRLALVGSIREEVLPLEDIARALLEALSATGVLATDADEADPVEAYGRAKGFLSGHGKVDIQRTTMFLLKSFREGRFGAITLEAPPTREPLI